MKTSNYINLTENVTNEKEALIVANSTQTPCVLAERSRLLLFDFITRYLEGKEERERLINELSFGDGATVSAHLFSIYETIAEISQMLNECQTLTLSEKKYYADNK